MEGLIILRAWIVLFQLTSQVSFFHTALYSVPRERQLSLNGELGMTYSNCCCLKCGPIFVNATAVGFCFVLDYFLLCFPKASIKGIHLFKSIYTIPLVGGDRWGAKIRLVKSVERDQLR